MENNKIKVLIVEDSPYYYERAGIIANKIGILPFFAYNGKDAIVMYNDIKPDFVIMDICMPEMDGLEATLKIKNKHKEAKIYICSSVGNIPIYRKKAIKNGACGFLNKEFTLEELKNIIEKLKFYN